MQYYKAAIACGMFCTVILIGIAYFYKNTVLGFFTDQQEVI